jgi:hypothetical protein
MTDKSFEVVPAILGYGSLGLAFLMMFLAYMSLRVVLQQPNPQAATLNLCKQYLYVAFAFVIAAAALNWGTIWVQHLAEKKSVTIVIQAPTAHWEKAFGRLTLDHRTDRPDSSPVNLLSGDKITEEFDDKEYVILNSEEIIDFIRTIRQQLDTARSAAVKDHSANTAQQGG